MRHHHFEITIIILAQKPNIYINVRFISDKYKIHDNLKKYKNKV